ncbi:MAG: serine/threonine protein kinase [Planctomycetes bacterium]|nr:serine/threonine protein kinase [Planctomycetota bacterium]
MPVCYSPSDKIRGDFGEFTIVEELGQGGQVHAYRALDPIGFQVCLKVLIRPSVAHANHQLRCASLLSKTARTPGWEHAINHIVAPTSYFINGDHFLVEPYIEGETVAHRLQPDNRIVYQSARHILKAVTLALMLFERAGFAHRDPTPSNIQMFMFDNVVLLDLGLSGELLRPPIMPGFTPGYAPPEQYAHASVNTASDVYCLGATAYHMLTGCPPFPTAPTEEFHGLRWNASLAKHLHTAQVPEEVIALIGRMLAYEPTDRPSLREVIKTL